MLKAIANVFGKIGSAAATVVSLPFRAVGRLFGGASDTGRGGH
ncbi:LPFR motif small protein [Streptomyces sp. NPDC008139]